MNLHSFSLTEKIHFCSFLIHQIHTSDSLSPPPPSPVTSHHQLSPPSSLQPKICRCQNQLIHLIRHANHNTIIKSYNNHAIKRLSPQSHFNTPQTRLKEQDIIWLIHSKLGISATSFCSFWRECIYSGLLTFCPEFMNHLRMFVINLINISRNV